MTLIVQGYFLPTSFLSLLNFPLPFFSSSLWNPADSVSLVRTNFVNQLCYRQCPLGLVFWVRIHLSIHFWSSQQWWSWSLLSSLLSSRNGKKLKNWSLPFIIFFNLLFILYWSTVSVLVSGVQQIDSVIHIHLPFFVRFCSLYRLLQNIEQSSLCYTGGPCSVSILYIVACIC